MTTSDELATRRAAEALAIRTSLNRQRGVQRANTKGGEGTVAYVTAENEVPWTGLTAWNPPLLVGAFYCVGDLLVNLSVAKFEREVTAEVVV